MKMKREELDFAEFDRRFPSEKVCRDYLYGLLFSDGFRCPSAECQHKLREMWEVKPYKYKCRKCGYQTSLTAPIDCFCHTHLPMLTWFKAIYYMCIRRERATAVELQKVADIGSNKTSQKVVRKLQPMLYRRPKNKLLKGLVALGAEYIIFSGDQIGLAIAAEIDNKRVGRTVIVPLPDVEDIFKSHLSPNASPRKLPRYTNRVAKAFEAWCNKKEQDRRESQEAQQGIEVFKIDELMQIYSATTFLYRTPVDFDDVLGNILNYGTEKDYSSYYDKSII